MPVKGTRRVQWAATAVLAAVLGLPAGAAAAPGGADDWGAAELLAPSTVFVFDNSAKTVQGAEPLTNGEGYCTQATAGTTMDRTIWWYVTGTGGRIILSSRGSAMDSVIAAYKTSGAPSLANALECSDDRDGDDGRITLENTVAGARYLVQAGSCDLVWNSNTAAWQDCGAGGGAVHMSSVTNDQRSHADPSTSGARANVGASLDSGETSSCNGANYGSTVWFRYTADRAGWVTAQASRFDTVISLFRGSESQPLACSDGAQPDDPLKERLRHYVTPGEYFIQVGGKDYGSFSAQDNFSYDLGFEEDRDIDKDGSPRPEDCDDNNAGVRPGKPDIAHNGIDEDCVGGDSKDGDGDNHAAAGAGGDDCDDGNPHIHPGVADKPNNRIDENCDGRDDAARLPTTPQVSFRSAPFRRGVVFATLYVRDLRKGYRVEIRCRRSRNCPRVYRTKVRRGRSVAFHRFRRKAFRSRTRVEVFVRKPGNVIGFYKSYTVRGRKNPRQRVCELDPGKPRKPVRCR